MYTCDLSARLFNILMQVLCAREKGDWWVDYGILRRYYWLRTADISAMVWSLHYL